MKIIESKATKQLLVPRVTATVNLFPEAHALTHLSQDYLVLPHGLREFKILKHLGFKVTNPFLKFYDWKGGKPFAVQRATVGLCTANARAYVLNDMGTGKTRAALWSWDALNDGGYAKKLLVVAPLSTLNFVWARECFATLPRRKVVVLHGTKKQRLEKLDTADADIFIINHDGLKVIHEALELHTEIDTLILDELAVYRNNSDRSKLMRKFAERFQWVWGMSGEPMPNSPVDVWSQCKIITPSTVPKYKRQAEDMLMTRVSQFVLRPKPDAVDTAFRWMQPSVRYSLDDVVELPDSISRTIDVELSDQQKEVYRKVATEFQAMVKDKTITALNAGAAMNKLLQISGGWVYSGNPREVIKLDNKARMDTLVDLVNSAARKVLVFAPFRHTIAGISEVFTGKDPFNPMIEHVIVHGDVPDRDQIFNEFQNTTKYKVMLAHPQCLAHGLTLTAADTIIWYSPTASLDIYNQSNARIRRVGQHHKQQILHIQSTPVEKKIYALLRTKTKIQDQLLTMFEEATSMTT
jgi:SNF2 family DNA or RNA helicase